MALEPLLPFDLKYVLPLQPFIFNIFKCILCRFSQKKRCINSLLITTNDSNGVWRCIRVFSPFSVSRLFLRVMVDTANIPKWTKLIPVWGWLLACCMWRSMWSPTSGVQYMSWGGGDICTFTNGKQQFLHSMPFKMSLKYEICAKAPRFV